MKKFLKVLALGTAASLMALSFAACGGDPASTGSNGESSEAAALDLVKDGTLIMGTNAEFPPLSFRKAARSSAWTPRLWRPSRRSSA